MALINCPECNKEVSSLAASCPNCGCPISVDKTSQPTPSIAIDFPDLPIVTHIGSQITNWGFDAALQDCYYSADINNTRYIKEGKVNVYAHTNGISIHQGFSFFNISHQQIISMNFISHKELTNENKSVVGRAVVGGLLLGPLGAIVGGMSGIGSKIKTLGNFYFAINFYDVYTRSIQTILLITKEENQRFIVRCEKEKEANNTPSIGLNCFCNLLDDNGKLSEKKVLEALKIVGETKVADEVALVDGCGSEMALLKVRKIGQNNNVDTSSYNKGCMITIILAISSFLTACSLVCL